MAGDTLQMKKRREVLILKITGRLLEALKKKAKRRGFEGKENIYFIRLTLAKFCKMKNLNDVSVNRGV